MRIAIIGSGISGLSAAYLLAPHADVTLFERDAELGGHAHTARVQFGENSIPVDTGFMVFNPAHYPYFVALLKALNIPSIETVMSFSVSIPGHVEYSSNLSGLFGNPRQLLRPAYWRLLYDILRFNNAAKAYLNDVNADRTLHMGEFVKQHAFSRELVEWYRFPMMGSIWSAAAHDLDEYPAHETFRFLNNHLLLNIFNKPIWHTVQNGSRSYVEALESALTKEGVRIQKNSPVNRITRSDQGVTITVDAREEAFDRIIIATHADTARALLSDATEHELSILGAFTYSENDVVLHSDASFMPESKRAWASWNYHSGVRMDPKVSLTYHMNSLQSIPDAYPLFVTLNPRRSVDPTKVHATYSYAHPIFNMAARRAQMDIAAIQGARGTYYAGAHLGFGFHEDGMQSGVRAVEALGFPIRLTPSA